MGRLGGAQQIVHALDLLGEQGSARSRYHGPAHHVAMPVEVLRRGVDDEVGPEGEGSLEEGREEGVVHGHQAVRVAMAHRGHGGDVREPEQGIGGRLDPDHARVGPEGRLQGPEVRQVQVGDLQAVEPPGMLQQPESTSITIHSGDEVAAVGQQVQGHQDGAHARAGAGGAVAPLQQGEGLLQGRAGGVAAAGVVVARVGADVLEGEGGRQVERWHDRAVGGVRLHAPVHALGGQARIRHQLGPAEPTGPALPDGGLDGEVVGRVAWHVGIEELLAHKSLHE